MAKYNWQELEQEFILGGYKSVNDFLNEKNIAYGSGARKHTKDWKVKKSNKSQKKSEKVIEKVIEKESTKEANNIVKLNDVANKLLEKIGLLSNEVNERSIKSLTSALKDINDILNGDNNNNDNKRKVIIMNDLPKRSSKTK